MPRKPRFFLPDIPVHIVQRGHSREPVFFEESDYRAYLDWLTEAAERYQCAVHAYVLMTNHVHILATLHKSDSVSRMMQYVGRRYVPYVNYTYGTSGSIWEGRFKAQVLLDDAAILAENPRIRNSRACYPAGTGTAGDNMGITAHERTVHRLSIDCTWRMASNRQWRR